MTAGRPPHGLFCPSGRSLLAAHSYPALARGHTTTLPYLATLPRLSPGPAIRPPSPCRPSGHPPFQTCGTTRSVALPAARPPDFTATPSPVRPPLHLPSLCPLPYNRSPVHGSAFLTPRTPRSAAQPLGHPAARPLWEIPLPTVSTDPSRPNCLPRHAMRKI